MAGRVAGHDGMAHIPTLLVRLFAHACEVHPVVDEVPLRRQHGTDDAVAGRLEDVLHLHRFDHHDWCTWVEWPPAPALTTVQLEEEHYQEED